MKKGLIQVYTGEGKGKTTVAVGQIIRAVGRGYRVMMVYFLKSKRSSGEMPILRNLGAKTFFWGGEYGEKLIRKESTGNLSLIKKESKEFLEQIKQELAAEEYNLLVLDEVNVAVKYDLLDKKELLDFLKQRPPGVEIILTGRGAPEEFISVAHLVTEMKNIKYPYQQGTVRRKGIEY